MGFQNWLAVPAPEARKPVAQGETVGLSAKWIKPRQRAVENRHQNISGRQSG